MFDHNNGSPSGYKLALQINKMKLTLLYLVALSLSGCGPSNTEREASKERRAAEARKADEQMAAGPNVVRHDRNGLTVWTIDIPRQFSSGGLVWRERCIAVATPGHRATLSCESHSPKGEDGLDLLDDREIDARGR